MNTHQKTKQMQKKRETLNNVSLKVMLCFNLCFDNKPLKWKTKRSMQGEAKVSFINFLMCQINVIKAISSL